MKFDAVFWFNLTLLTFSAMLGGAIVGAAIKEGTSSAQAQTAPAAACTSVDKVLSTLEAHEAKSGLTRIDLDGPRADAALDYLSRRLPNFPSPLPKLDGMILMVSDTGTSVGIPIQGTMVCAVIRIPLSVMTSYLTDA